MHPKHSIRENGVTHRVLRIQSLDHHLLLSWVLNHEITVGKRNPHRIHNSVKAARGTTLLGKANDAEPLFLTMLKHRHHLYSKRNWFEIQVCVYV